MTPPVAIAVVSWNTRELLDACLRSLHADAQAARAEVWVFDNASSDGSPDLVAERHPWVRLIRSSENLGYGRAVNRVAAQTAAAWVAPSNADVEVEPGALQALLDAGAADPGAGAVAPRLVLRDGSTQASVQVFPSPLTALLEASRVHRVSRRAADRLLYTWDEARPARVPWVAGAFLIVRREAWDAVGGFDESTFLYGEDLDLCWRLGAAGWGTRYEPAAVVHHHESAATRQAFGDRYLERWVGGTYAWMARRRGVSAAWATGAILAAEGALRLAALRLRGGTDERRARARQALAAGRLGLRSRRALVEGR